MRRSVQVGICLGAALAALGLSFHPASGNHLSCRQYDGNDNDNTVDKRGDDLCDEIWTYGGQDWVNAGGGGDYVSAGSGADEVHGHHGNDDPMYGGENGNSIQDRLYGGLGNDGILDRTGPDADLICGGDGNDNSLSADDSDGYDTVKGEAGTDGVHGDPGLGDTVLQDGSC